MSGSSGYFSTAGEVSIFSNTLMAGSTSLAASSADFTLREQTTDAFGVSITTSDTDGDGADEIFVAAPGVASTSCCSVSYPTGTVWSFDPL